MPNVNWLVVVVVLCTTAGLLYLGYSEWQLRVVQNPLREELANMAGIISFDLQPTKQAHVLVLTVDPKAEFPQVARQVNRLVSLGAYQIVWEDNPNALLLEVRNQLDLALQEARWHRQFVLLEERVAESTLSRAVEYQLGVDEGYIYLALYDETYSLREAIPLLPVGGGTK